MDDPDQSQSRGSQVLEYGAAQRRQSSKLPFILAYLLAGLSTPILLCIVLLSVFDPIPNSQIHILGAITVVIVTISSFFFYAVGRTPLTVLYCVISAIAVCLIWIGGI